MIHMDFRNIHTTGNSSRDALPCPNMALKKSLANKNQLEQNKETKNICVCSSKQKSTQIFIATNYAFLANSET